MEAAAGRRLPGALLLPTGFAAVTVVGQFTTLADATAELTVPVAGAVAVGGFGVAIARRRPLRPPLALVAMLAALLCVYAAPIVASGDATLAGYLKLDDTATWLAFTDRIMEHGRDLSGLPVSTYERTLEVNIGEGYPIGAFVPFGIGVSLASIDAAWLIQPYMAATVLLFALAAWTLIAPLVPSRGLRAFIVFVGSQPALLFGYYLWGGMKEVAAAALIAGAAACAAFALANPGTWRAAIPLALTSSALVGLLSPGALIWLAPILVLALVGLARELAARALAVRAAGFSLAMAFLCLPVVLPGALKPPTSSPLADDEAKGNLVEPLDPLQAAGVWLAGDFRFPSDHELLVAVAAGAIFGFACLAGVWAWRAAARGLVTLFAAGVLGCAVLVALGSPWVGGKAMATASPIVLLAALVGATAVGSLVRPVVGFALAGAIAALVLGSNALAYRDVNLAPHDHFAELKEIGEMIAGEGPTLMTEYSPYGARHFLREADPESVSELRYRLIPLISGEPVPKGLAADTDKLDPRQLAVYRALVIRRSPVASRPPAAYELTQQGDFYEVWQRPRERKVPSRRLALGTRRDPVAMPACPDVLKLAESARSLVAATGESPIVAAPVVGPGSVTAEVEVSRPGQYEVWLGGSLKPRAVLYVDGEEAGEARHVLNNRGGYVALGEAALDRGTHEVELRVDGADLHPGSGGDAGPLGPLLLSRAEAADSRLVRVPSQDARELCGARWDWIEAVP